MRTESYLTQVSFLSLLGTLTLCFRTVEGQIPMSHITHMEVKGLKTRRLRKVPGHYAFLFC